LTKKKKYHEVTTHAWIPSKTTTPKSKTTFANLITLKLVKRWNLNSTNEKSQRNYLELKTLTTTTTTMDRLLKQSSRWDFTFRRIKIDNSNY
jgi:hypothetical protein